jgi:hypothetical protein
MAYDWTVAKMDARAKLGKTLRKALDIPSEAEEILNALDEYVEAAVKEVTTRT